MERKWQKKVSPRGLGLNPEKKSKLAERTKPVSCKRLLTLIPEVTEIIIAAIGMNVPCNRL